MNAVHLLGKVLNDPELHKTHVAGQSVVNLRLLTHEVWRDRDDHRQERTDCHRLVLWGNAAEIAAERIRKNDVIGIDGKLQTRTYEKNGETRTAVEVTVTRLHLPLTDTWYDFPEEDKPSTSTEVLPK